MHCFSVALCVSPIHTLVLSLWCTNPSNFDFLLSPWLYTQYSPIMRLSPMMVVASLALVVLCWLSCAAPATALSYSFGQGTPGTTIAVQQSHWAGAPAQPVVALGAGMAPAADRIIPDVGTNVGGAVQYSCGRAITRRTDLERSAHFRLLPVEGHDTTLRRIKGRKTPALRVCCVPVK